MRENEINALCKAVFEMNKQAPYDFCGEQREFYLPRLTECLVNIAKLFPKQLSRYATDAEVQQ